MKITADFTCLLKKTEQEIRENSETNYRIYDLMFEMEEKDYDQAIRICRKYTSQLSDHMCEDLESLKQSYLNINYDNFEERSKFLNNTNGWNLNPLRFPSILEHDLQYKKTWKKKEEIAKTIQEHYYSTAEYLVLRGLEEQVKQLLSYWVGRSTYLKEREEREVQFQHLCNLPSDFNSMIPAA